jgi:hypothetical protein
VAKKYPAVHVDALKLEGQLTRRGIVGVDDEALVKKPLLNVN